ncbi:hypothetical protein EOE67_10820 [Rheinheimera riviphila]|uniref:VCBS repeat-containing protein n=1 Tax=Rheinheimera riviphila TaxID=1834037 RepID=A0A437QS73_9GAMM|nr:hypothetical protein [Rheinheimera riviphila]RVU37366.1 hypothetical protein EOE67_10820 [Rheinheimera riviphila]
MNIVAANQHFAVHEHSVLHSGRLEQAAIRNAVKLPAPADNQRPSLATSATNFSQARQALATAALSSQNSAQNSSAEAPTESTTSTEQNEDKQRFNALQTVGAVKRILDQLSSGKLLSWIDGTSMEKIQAQVAEQQQNSAAGSTPPAPTAAPATRVTEWSYRYQELDANFSGALSMADGSTLSWSFELNMREEQFSFRTFTEEQLKDPLILSLGGNAVDLKSTGTDFDFYGNGERRQLPDLGKGQYYLMRDSNKNQRLDSGLELFGPKTGQGYSELAELDDNQNGFIEASDTQWQSLNLWSRQQGMQSLQQANIAAISAQSVATSFGLYDRDALLGRIARSGIFLAEQNPLAPFSVGLVQQVDLNI